MKKPIINYELAEGMLTEWGKWQQGIKLEKIGFGSCDLVYRSVFHCSYREFDSTERTRQMLLIDKALTLIERNELEVIQLVFIHEKSYRQAASVLKYQLKRKTLDDKTVAAWLKSGVSNFAYTWTLLVTPTWKN